MFQGNIITCGVVGAYTVVLTVNAYTYTSLSYITLDVLKRLLNHSFSRAFISVPLQDIGRCAGSEAVGREWDHCRPGLEVNRGLGQNATNISKNAPLNEIRYNWRD